MSDPMSANRSALNPTDAAFMKKSGQVQTDTIGQYLETAFGIKWEDPVEVASQKMQKSMQNADPMKKMQNIAASPPPQGGVQKPMPQGAKPMVSPGGLDGLMGKL